MRDPTNNSGGNPISAGQAPVLPSTACRACSGRPCSTLYGLGGSYPRPIVLNGFHSVPALCPVLLSRRSSQDLHVALRWMSSEDLSYLARYAGGEYQSVPNGSPFSLVEAAIHCGRLQVLYPILGSEADRILKAAAPRFRPRIRPKNEKAKTSDPEVEKDAPKPALQNPQWVWLEDAKKPGCEEKILAEIAVFDFVWCKVDSVALMPGDSVTFSIFLKGREGNEDVKITTVSGRVGEGRKDNAAVGRYALVSEVQGKRLVKKKDKLYFIAKVFTHQLEVKSGLIDISPVKPPFAFSL